MKTWLHALVMPLVARLSGDLHALPMPSSNPVPKQVETGAGSIASCPVKVEIFEDLPAGSELELGDAHLAEFYRERAFGFVRIPAKYSGNALALDRSTPFVSRASLNRRLP